MSARLLGIGTACPDGGLTQEQALDALLRLTPQHAAKRSALGALFRRTEVVYRHSSLLSADVDRPPFVPDLVEPRGPGTAARMAAFDVAAPPLAIAAARTALGDAAADPATITHLISVTCTGFVAPGFDVDLIDALGLARTVERTQVGFMGCHGTLNGLRVAKALVEADPTRRVLLVALELCSAHLSYQLDEGAIVSNSLFADGSAAAVVGAGSGLVGPRLVGSGALIIPDTRDLMTWRVGDHGFEMTLSPRVPAAIEATLPGWLDRWLTSLGHVRADLCAFAIHPGGPRVLSAVERSLDLPPSALAASRGVFREHGNMSSPTLLFILDALRSSGASGLTLALGFGPGLAIEAALIDL